MLSPTCLAGNRNGPGRNAGDPNFVLSEITIERLPADGGPAQMLKIQSAIADFEQKGWPVKNAFDGNLKTGWAVSPRFNADHLARFTLEHPLDFRAGDQLRVRLSQQYGLDFVSGVFARLLVSQALKTFSLTEELQTAMLVDLVSEKLTTSRRQLVGQIRSHGKDNQSVEGGGRPAQGRDCEDWRKVLLPP